MMKLPDPAADAHTRHIQKRLQNFAQEHDVRILLAVESGSRAWGFASKNSDYDVRFIYARKPETYLSIRDYRDTLESPLVQDETLGVPLDLNGWDVRKALGLAVRSNPVLSEWLVSPVRYIETSEAGRELLAFAGVAANLHSFRYHYDRLARSAWKKIEENPAHANVKHYCYALRPVLAAQWIVQRRETPPMDIASLCQGLIKNPDLQTAIDSLIERKATLDEAGHIPRIPVVDALIADILADRAQRPDIIPPEPKFLTRGDALFRKILGDGL